MTTLFNQTPGTRDQEEGRLAGLSMGRAVAVLIHDLRTPLGAIQNALDVLQLARAADPIVANAVGVMGRQVRHLGRLVGDLLDLTRDTTGKLELSREWLDLATVVAHAVEACRPFIEQHRHQLIASLPVHSVWLHADPTRLQQVLVNLLTNAARYTDPGGHIWLTVESATDVVVRVRDDGVGISPDMLPRIFDLFQQGPQDHGRDGLGIGLALVRCLVERHGGGVTAHSDGPGKGTEFVVRLPLSMDLPIKRPLALAPPHWPRSVGVAGAGVFGSPGEHTPTG